MSITATSNGSQQRELIPAGSHIARCYKMIHVGTVEEEFQGEKKKQNKVRIGWELPEELRTFGDKGELPLVIDKEYTLSMHEKSTLRAHLAAWRGKDFSETEAKGFDITKLIGKPCMLNIIHQTSKTGTTYARIAGISPLHKSVKAPAPINAEFILDFNDNWDEMKYDTLPDFIRLKIATSDEYKKIQDPSHNELEATATVSMNDDLPF